MGVKKPAPIKCSICGEMIEPVLDGMDWLSGAAGPIMVSGIDGNYKSVGGKFHPKCFEHAAIWKRIRAIEDETDRRYDDGN